MTTPRRRLLRIPLSAPVSGSSQQERLLRLRQRLASERAALARWMTRLRRAFHAVEKRLQSIARVERQIRQSEEP
jgi:hypothetical protein